METQKEIIVYNEIKELKKILTRDKPALVNLNLLEMVNLIKSVSPWDLFKEVFLEFLLRISQALYWKSCILLNISHEEPEEREKEEFQEEREIIREYNYYKCLPVGRILFEKIFLPAISEVIIEKLNFKTFDFSEGEINKLLKAILSVVERESIKSEFLEDLPDFSIETYIEEIKSYLDEKKSFTFKKFIKDKIAEEKKEEYLLKIVYYFLALLFLCYQSYCILVQNSEKEDITVFCS